MRTLRILILLLLLGGIPTLAAAGSHLSSDPDIVRARTLVLDGNFNGALEVLRRIDPGGANRTDVLFLTGLAAVGASGGAEEGEGRDALLDEAVTAFRAILVDRPDLVRVRLELARAFFLKGEDGLARRHFERVLGGNPARAVVANINNYLAVIRARKRWTARAGAALAPDTNLGAESEAEIIYIYGLPFRRDAETTSGVGLTVWGGGEYQYPLGNKLRLRAGADVSRREYRERRFDQTFLSAHLGPRWLIDRDAEASLIATAYRRWLGGERYSDSVGTYLDASRRLGRRFTARTRLGMIYNRHHAGSGSNGPVLSATVMGSWVVMPTMQLTVRVGHERQRTRTERTRSRALWVGGDLALALPAGFSVGFGVEFRGVNYEDGWFPFVPDNGTRKDRVNVLRASVFNRSLTLFGFSPEITVIKARRASTAQLHDYDRLQGELRFQRLF